MVSSHLRNMMIISFETAKIQTPDYQGRKQVVINFLPKFQLLSEPIYMCVQ